MDDDDQFLNQVLSGIAEAEIITIFFPLLRRALVVDTRHDEHTPHMVRVVPQVNSMEERIAVIQKMRPEFGKVRSILGIPWIKSVGSLREQGVVEKLITRLRDTEMPPSRASDAVEVALERLARVERRAFVAMIRGEGYQTIWAATE
jgi:hypothetical protein